jgi:hypothetical protein
MKTPSHDFAQKLRRILRSVVSESASQHDRLLINSLAAFNFRPPLIFSNRELVRASGYFQ